MRVESLEINNLYGIKGTKKIDLSASIVALWGGNGTGKSSVIESIRFAITGNGKINVLHAGETDGYVEITIGETSIRRVVSFYEGKYKLQSFVDGKKVSSANAFTYISELFQTKTSDIKLLTSKNLTTSLEDGAGDLLMSYMDNSIPRDEVIDMVISHNASNSHVSAEDIRTYGEKILPERISYESVSSILKSERDNRRITKKEGDSLNARLKNMDTSGADYNQEELNKDLERLQNAQAAANVLLEKAKQANDILAKRKKASDSIKALEVKKVSIVEASEKIDSSCIAGRSVTSADITDLEKLESDVNDKVLSAEKDLHSKELELSVIDNDLFWIDDITKKLNSGGCPFSSEKLVVKCTTDMSPVLSDLASRKTETLERQAAVKKVIDENKSMISELKKDLLAVRDFLSFTKQYRDLNTRVQELSSAMPPEVEAVKPDTTDYRTKIKEVQDKLFRCSKYNEYLQTRENVMTLAHKWYLCDMFVRILSDDGPVVSLLVEEYRKLLTEAANGISETTGIYVKFVTGKGIDMLFKTAESEFRPYTSLSAGEQVLAYITISDMLSRLSGYHLLVIDDMDKLDNQNLECVIRLLSENISGYENIVIAGVNHDGTKTVLDKYGVQYI